MHYHATIVGGGCGGLWLLHELVERGYRATLLETGQLGRYASTHGQNRLHTGALYALVYGESQGRLIAASSAGFDDLIRFSERYAPGAILRDSPGCLYIYQNEERFNTAVSNIGKNSGTGLRPLSQVEINSSEFEDVKILVPYLRHALISPEVVFNPELLLSSVASRSLRQGATIISTLPSFDKLHIVQSNNGWSIQHAGAEILTSNVVIYAAGILNAFILERLLTLHKDVNLVSTFKNALDLTRISILHEPLLKRIVCFQDVTTLGHISAMPIGNTTSITSGGGGMNELIDPSDVSVPNQPGYEGILAEMVTRCMPGILRSFPIPTHFYMCQKVNNVDHPLNPFRGAGARHFFWIEPTELPNVFFYTPGKWTIATVAAKTFVDELEQRGSFESTAKLAHNRLAAQQNTPVAQRPCYDKETHVFDRISDRVAFVKL